MQQNQVDKMVAHLFREQAGKMIAALVNIFGFENLPVAEDVVQETFITAYQDWPYKAVPDDPAAWLFAVARNKAINVLKQNRRIQAVEHSAFLQDTHEIITQQVEHAFTKNEINDSQLKLLFMCCHPSLPVKSQAILTLQVLCGFSLEEIANAMLMQKEAVKKTLLRTRHEVRDKQLYKQTNHVLLSGKRIGIILQVLYLMFNEGYKTTEDKKLINNDLCFEAIRLCKLLLPLKHHAGEVNALLALMFFNIARFPARLNDAGEIVLLQHQDRSKWNTAFINEGFAYLAHSRCGHALSRYHLEAGIAAVHCAAKNYDDTDWQRIIFYYDQLMLIDQSPVIAIHRAIAVGESMGCEYGLHELERVETGNKLEGYYLFYASKAELLFKLERFSEAAGLYEKALNHTRSVFNQQILKTRIQECFSHLKRHTNELFQ